jgi:hypothetical protein
MACDPTFMAREYGNFKQILGEQKFCRTINYRSQEN